MTERSILNEKLRGHTVHKVVQLIVAFAFAAAAAAAATVVDVVDSPFSG